MDMNTLAIIIETVALITSIVIGIYSVKKTKKDINGDDLLNIFINNKDALLKIINDISNIKTKDKTANDVRKLISIEIDEFIEKDILSLNDFQKKIVEVNKEFFVTYLFDKVIDKIGEKE